MRQGLTLKTIRQLDKSDMLGLLLDFPQQCQAALDIAKRVKINFTKTSFTKIVFAGLGGSAIGADLVRNYLYAESKLPISVFREYELPAYIDESTLLIVSSYSGNTEETLASYKQVKAKGVTLIAISSGGALKEYAQQDNFTFIQIPQNLPPRCALGYMSVIPLCVLSRLGLVRDHLSSINQMINVLSDLREKNLNPNITRKDNLAKSLALKLWNKFVVIYSESMHFDVCAVRFRGQLAENAKALASSHVFPEMNHNEIVGWQNPAKCFKNFVVVMLRDKENHPRTARRFDITKDILKKEGIEVLEIWSRGEGLLSRIFSLIYIGDFISLYLAILYGLNPTPVDRVTYLKNRLAKE